MGELRDWLTKEAFIPREKIMALATDASAAGKSRWHKLTRETFVRTMVKDYEAANKVTPEQLDTRKDFLMQKYGLTKLDSWKEIDNSVRSEPLTTLSDQAKKLLTDMKDQTLLEKRVIEAELKGRYRDDFAVNEDTIRCVQCDIPFSTSIAAMGRHIEVHKQGMPTKISKTDTHKFRPEEHLYKPAIGRYFSGSDANLYDIRGVDGHLQKFGEKEWFVCKKCGSRVTPYNRNGSLASRGISVSNYQKHVESCKGT